MKGAETICFEIDSIIDAIKDNTINAFALVSKLKHIQKQAQKMENGLRGRKGFMTRSGIEEAYKKHYKPSLKSHAEVNKLVRHTEITAEEVAKLKMEITILQNGELVYKGRGCTGLISIMESEAEFDETGVLVGNHQEYMFGNIKGIFLSMDLLKQSVDKRKDELVAAAVKKFGRAKLNQMIDEFNQDAAKYTKELSG